MAHECMRRGDVEFIREAIPCDEGELRTAIEIRVNAVQTPADVAIRGVAAAGIVPRLEFAEERRARAAQVRLLRFDAVALHRTSDTLETDARLLELAFGRPVALEVRPR